MAEGSRNMVSQYFQFIIERRFGEAEKKLEEIRQALGQSKQEAGYLKALEGLLLTYRSSNDRYLYLANLDLTSKNVEALKKEFSEQAESPLHADYDKRYFSALADFMRAVGRLRPWRSQERGRGTEKDSTAKKSSAA